MAVRVPHRRRLLTVLKGHDSRRYERHRGRLKGLHQARQVIDPMDLARRSHIVRPDLRARRLAPGRPVVQELHVRRRHAGRPKGHHVHANVLEAVEAVLLRTRVQ